MKTRNLAIVFVDIVDFTRITAGLSRERTASWTSGFEKLGRRLASQLGGRVIKSLGDALLLIFDSPTDALLFGMAFQDSIHLRNLEHGEPEMQIRVAVNVGEVSYRRGDILGEPVNVAARLEAVTPPGAIWFTASTYLAMTRSEIPAEVVGSRRFKGVAEPVEIYRVVPSSQYQLRGRGESGAGIPPHPAGQPAYPYGGLGLQKLGSRATGSAANWLELLANAIPRLGERTLGIMARLAPGWRRCLTAAGLALLVLLVAVVAWPENPFAEISRALEAGKAKRALSLIENHRLRDSAEGKLWHARVLLALPRPQVATATALLQQALAERPALLADSRTIDDLVACLDQPQAKSVSRFIARKLGKHARDALVEASRSRRYWLRWNSIRLLQALGLAEDIDMGQAYLLDLQYAGSCSTRKRAARKLAELHDSRALPALQQAKQRGLLENLCMGDTLDEAIRAINTAAAQ